MHATKTRPYLPRFNKSTWNVGLAPWLGMKVECLKRTNQIHCDSGGFELEYLKIFARIFNKSLNFVFPNTQGCGRRLTNGTFTGLIGELAAGEIDIIGNICALYDERVGLEFAKFTYPIIQSKQNFLIKATQTGYKFDPRAPFQQEIWYSIIGLCFMILVLNSIFLKLFNLSSFVQGFKISVELLLQTFVGFDFNKQPFAYYLWYSMKTFFAVICSLYSMYIASVLFRPFPVAKPFENNLQLANEIANGRYRIISNRNPIIYPRCHDDAVCNKFKSGIANFGYRYIEIGSRDGEINEFLNEIVLNRENYVFVTEKVWTDFFLKRFPDNEKLWLFEDQQAADTLYGYFYHKRNSEIAKYLDKAIVLMGDYKQNLYDRYFREVSSINQGRNLKVRAEQNSMRISLDVIKGPVVLYVVGVVFSFATAFAEFKLAMLKFGHQSPSRHKRLILKSDRSLF